MLLATYLFAKTVNFSFLINKISRKCPRTILKSLKDSLESEEYFRQLQNILEVHRKLFLRHFQKTFFFENPPFYTCLGYFSIQKGGLSKKNVFRKCLRKSFLCSSGMLCRYLKCSSDSGLSSDEFRMILGHFLEIFLIKNEKLTVFAKRYAARSVCKGLKKPYFDENFDFKCL